MYRVIYLMQFTSHVAIDLTLTDKRTLNQKKCDGKCQSSVKVVFNLQLDQKCGDVRLRLQPSKSEVGQVLHNTRDTQVLTRCGSTL